LSKPTDQLETTPDAGAVARLQELLADRLAGGDAALSPAELQQLALLERAHPAEAAMLEYEFAAAATAFDGGRGWGTTSRDVSAAALPVGLHSALCRDAELVLGPASAGGAAAAGSAATAGSITAAGAGGSALGKAILFGVSWRGLAIAGWTSALAALATVGTLGLTIWNSPINQIGGVPIVVEAEPPSGSADSVAVLTYHVAKDRDAQRFELSAFAREARVTRSGEAIWSDRRQGGLLYVEKLPAIRGKAYQAWIIDADRPADEQAVSAALFDVREGIAVRTVALQPSLPIGQAAGVVIAAVDPQGTTHPDPAQIFLQSAPD
jgi:hypothetical protein